LKITVDTNILVRLFVNDDTAQSAIARALLAETETVVVTLPTLCELAWVLSRRYGIRSSELGAVIQDMIDSRNVEMNRSAVDAGLDHLLAGGDFADGVMAYEGGRLNAEAFVSFDRKAVRLLAAAGHSARLAG
jgi:predicted nucleic-acid-binding protein